MMLDEITQYVSSLPRAHAQGVNWSVCMSAVVIGGGMKIMH